MKIAVSSDGDNENSQVSEVSGRAPFYLIFENGELKKVMKNPFRMGGGGAGFAVASMLADENIGLVVSGKFGHNMISALEENGIKHKEMYKLIVKEALEKLE